MWYTRVRFFLPSLMSPVRALVMLAQQLSWDFLFFKPIEV